MAEVKSHPITWAIEEWKNLPADEASLLYVDKKNVMQALEWLGKVEQSATDSTQTLCNELYLCQEDRSPLQFRGFDIKKDPIDAYTQLFVCHDGQNYINMGETWEPYAENAKVLNSMPLEKRHTVKFSNTVTLGNVKYALATQEWNEGTWMETIIHEVGIHVMQDLDTVQLWRQGSPWPSAFAYGELDHLVFRYRGTPKYIWWCNEMPSRNLPPVRKALGKWEQKELGRYQQEQGFWFVEQFRKAVARFKQGMHEKPSVPPPKFDFGKCWLIAERFNPNKKSPGELGLFADKTEEPQVDFEKSAKFVLLLDEEIERLLFGSIQPLEWFDHLVKGKHLA